LAADEKPFVAGREIQRAAKQLLVSVECRCPQADGPSSDGSGR